MTSRLVDIVILRLRRTRHLEGGATITKGTLRMNRTILQRLLRHLEGVWIKGPRKLEGMISAGKKA